LIEDAVPLGGGWGWGRGRDAGALQYFTPLAAAFHVLMLLLRTLLTNDIFKMPLGDSLKKKENCMTRGHTMHVVPRRTAVQQGIRLN